MSSLVSSFIILIAVLVVITWLSVAGLRRLRTYSKRRAGERRQEQAEQVKKSLANMRDSLSPEQKRVDQGNNDFEPTGHEAGQRAKESTGKPASQAQRTVGQDVDQRRATEAEPWATFLRGSIFEERGEYDLAEQAYRQAIRAYQQVIDSGHPEEAPRAAFDLGLMLDKLDEYNLAEEAYQQAIDSGHPEEAPRAAFNLGILFGEREEYDRAVEAYQQAIDSGHAEWTPKAVFNLGMLFEERGESYLAVEAYQKAIASEHSEAASKASLSLGVLFEQRGAYSLAEEAYQQAINSGDPEVAPKAVGNLRGLAMRYPESIRRG